MYQDIGKIRIQKYIKKKEKTGTYIEALDSFKDNTARKIDNHFNKTKDWALVQTAALVINKGVEVRLSLVRLGKIAWSNQPISKYPILT